MITATATTTSGIAVRILIDESEGKFSACVWDIAGECYIYAGRKKFDTCDDLIGYIVGKCKLTRIVW